jgi:hypothetical protein
MRSISTFCIFLLFILKGYCQTQSLEQRLKSTDQQVRCDAFYEVFGGGEPSNDFQAEKLYGKSTKQIYDFLGKPSSVGVLEYKGVNWLQVTYHFDVWPTKDKFKEYHEKGWRFSPALFFRNGKSVPSSEWGKETAALSTSITPEHMRFKVGGQFP